LLFGANFNIFDTQKAQEMKKQVWLIAGIVAIVGIAVGSFLYGMNCTFFLLFFSPVIFEVYFRKNAKQ
jgi:hypothetical protein